MKKGSLFLILCILFLCSCGVDYSRYDYVFNDYGETFTNEKYSCVRDSFESYPYTFEATVLINSYERNGTIFG